MTLPYRPIAMDEEGNLVALNQEEFEKLSDVQAKQGPTVPTLLQAVFFSSADTVDVADATPATSPCVGFVSALLPLAEVRVRREGELAGFVGLVPGAVYFVDPTVPGAITNTPAGGPGTVLQEVGTAVSPTVLLVTIDADWVVL